MTASPCLALALVSLVLHASPQQELGAPVVAQLVVEQSGGSVARRPVSGLEAESLEAVGGALWRLEGLGPAPAPLEGDDVARVRLVDGGEIFGQLQGGDGEYLDLRLVGGTQLRLAIEEIASLRLEARYPDVWTEPVVAAEAGDRLFRMSGSGLDRIDGTIDSFSLEGVTFETSLGPKTFPWAQVAALFVEVFEEEESPMPEEAVVVDLVDGSRMTFGFRRLTASGLDVVTPLGRGLRLPLDALAEVLVVGSGVQFLSELDPVEAADTAPFGDDLGMIWPARRDRCTSGGPLRAGGRVWTRGLGVHAPSRLAYDLGGEWAQLRGSVAIDDEVIPLPARGSVRFRVLGDGQVLWESEVLRGGDDPTRLPPLALKGVRQLVLEVDPADEMHVGDRADWLRLVLSR